MTINPRDLDNWITGHYGEDDPANYDPHGYTEADGLYFCDDCGAFAPAPEEVIHLDNCKPPEEPEIDSDYP